MRQAYYHNIAPNEALERDAAKSAAPLSWSLDASLKRKTNAGCMFANTLRAFGKVA